MYIVTPLLQHAALTLQTVKVAKGNVSTHSVTTYISRANHQCCIPPRRSTL